MSKLLKSPSVSSKLALRGCGELLRFQVKLLHTVEKDSFVRVLEWKRTLVDIGTSVFYRAHFHRVICQPQYSLAPEVTLIFFRLRCWDPVLEIVQPQKKKYRKILA